MIALKLFCASIVILFSFILLLTVLANIPDFIVFLKDCVDDTIYEWKNLRRRLK